MKSTKYLNRDFEEALKNVQNQSFDKEDIKRLLSIQEDEEKKKILETASKVREKFFSNKVFLYGFVYFSTVCRNNCNFCYYRKTNELPNRYRKDKKEIFEISKSLIEEGVNLIDITSGQDPYYEKNFGELLNIIEELSTLNRPIMVSPGVKNKDQIQKIHEKGADWYAIYQETHDLNLYKELRPNQSFKARKRVRKEAREAGLLAEDGLLYNLGEDTDSLARTIYQMSQEDVAQVRCMEYVRHDGVPLPEVKKRDPKLIIALLRLTNPRKLVPASLDIRGLDGISEKIRAGANVVTSIIPPDFSLSGVANHEYGIEDGERSPSQVKSYLEENGFRAARTQELVDYINGF
ncbi:MAG: (2R3R)-3-methylornithine synthase involved in pyrrolysine biosynthesis PylB [Candidatus Methanohalarchaeum thermophilum]|uniref:(2R3R)-3-methylornithine synthase involved in pyrrolysine biosynthesis PylB n=1 Tax=Methanohalarchaeum thermophilum TaxID=1903181 RepID=A0A1Q6DT86_METT1|nr:MAG: (2R3R)-3-methylornithine synthase involved in pyrrolysine biosynthesis PylB [Candidatus Methanohalarchaeum thermophilum]